jgi:hypothetical protein
MKQMSANVSDQEVMRVAINNWQNLSENLKISSNKGNKKIEK